MSSAGTAAAAPSLEELVAARARAAGASAAEIARDARRAALREALETWRLVEIAGCAAAHAVPSLGCGADCEEEGWRHAAAAASGERDAAFVGLRLAAACEALGRREAALAALARAQQRRPGCAPLRLARAKLLFRSGLKQEADAELAPVLEAFRRQCGVASGAAAAAVAAWEPLSARAAGDAYYIAGWVRIHLDDHTAAYAIWCEGASLVPGDARLVRQRRKRETWAPGAGAGAGAGVGSDAAELAGLVGAGAVVADAEADCVAHVLPPPPASALSAEAAALAAAAAAAGEAAATAPPAPPPDAPPDEPALLLFDAASQRRRVAFTSRRPLLAPAECAAVLALVDAHVSGALGGAWPSVRRSSVPTTDIAVEDMPALVPWLRALLASRVFPMLERCYPLLAGGRVLEARALRVHDAFIVRYDAARGSTSLPEHSDTSALSVSLSLNARGRDFDGGGLFLRCLESGAGGGEDGGDDRDGEGGVFCAPEGCATAFMGPLRHGGAPITRGVRVILVLFLYVEGFAYGELLRHVAATPAPAPTPGGRGYVVYRETVQLMEALEGDSGSGAGDEDA